MECKLLNNGFFLYPDKDGTFIDKPCCHFKSTDKDRLTVDNISQTFKSKYRINAIKDLHNNKKIDNCNVCWKHEAINSPSMRTRINDISVLSSETNTLEYLEFNTGNVCNIQCIMCNPMDSLRTKRYKNMFESLQVNKDWNNINARGYTKHEIDSIDISTFEHLKILKATGGETFYANSYWRLLERLVEHGYSNNISLVNVTNNTISLDKDKLELLDNFKTIKIYSSVDGIDDLCDTIRNGSDWKIVNNNIQQLLDLHKQNPDKFLHTEPHCVVQTSNLLQLDEIVNWWNNIKVDNRYKIFFRILDEPKYFDIKYVPKNVKELVLSKYYNIPELEQICKYCNDNLNIVDVSVVQNYVNIFEQMCVLNNTKPSSSLVYKELTNA